MKRLIGIIIALAVVIAVFWMGYAARLQYRQTSTVTLTILHTNDTHSQVEPIAMGAKNADCGGYARRMGLIRQERKADPDLLLLDAGDFSQGTPYFNFYNGRVEIDALNRMGYNVVTLGNHEFDNGVDTLAAVLALADFPVVCANYRVKGTPLQDIVKPYVTVFRKGLKIGVFGLGVRPDGLIAPQNFAPLQWEDPIPVANRIAAKLRNEEHCDVVICLSHLGTEMDEGIPCDTSLAAATANIDVIIGGHTHKVVENRHLQNASGQDVLLAQMGKSGAKVGKITLSLAR